MEISWKHSSMLTFNRHKLFRLVDTYLRRAISAAAFEGKQEYSNDFDLRKPLQRQFLSRQRIDCISLQECPELSTLHDRCATFLAQFPRYNNQCITYSVEVMYILLKNHSCQVKLIYALLLSVFFYYFFYSSIDLPRHDLYYQK